MPSKWFQFLRINYKLLLNQKKWSVLSIRVLICGIFPDPDSGKRSPIRKNNSVCWKLECQLKLFNAVMMFIFRV